MATFAAQPFGPGLFLRDAAFLVAYLERPNFAPRALPRAKTGSGADAMKRQQTLIKAARIARIFGHERHLPGAAQACRTGGVTATPPETPEEIIEMTFVVTDNCIKCKYTDCVEVCPVDCFYEGPNFLVIHPDECIDCALCEPECPAQAIFSEDEVPEDQQEYIELNADLAEVWPNITEKKDSLPDAEEWDGVKDKLQYLER